jgi:preprotein translocase subunit SecG
MEALTAWVTAAFSCAGLLSLQDTTVSKVVIKIISVGIEFFFIILIVLNYLKQRRIHKTRRNSEKTEGGVKILIIKKIPTNLIQ